MHSGYRAIHHEHQPSPHDRIERPDPLGCRRHRLPYPRDRPLGLRHFRAHYRVGRLLPQHHRPHRDRHARARAGRPARRHQRATDQPRAHAEGAKARRWNTLRLASPARAQPGDSRHRECGEPDQPGDARDAPGASSRRPPRTHRPGRRPVAAGPRLASDSASSADGHDRPDRTAGEPRGRPRGFGAELLAQPRLGGVRAGQVLRASTRPLH